MRIIPVIDIRDGVVVKAEGGVREKYLPLESVICNSTQPLKVAMAFEDLGFDELYIADLDGITYLKPNLEDFTEICDKTNLAVMVDAGVKSMDEVRDIQNTGVNKIIVATESIREPGFLDDVIKYFGKENIILSVDYKDKILSPCEELSRRNPRDLISEYYLQVDDVIVIDLNLVGSGLGPNMRLCEMLSDYGIIYGGGLRDLGDIKSLGDIVSGVLIGSIIHSGKITSRITSRDLYGIKESS